MKYMCSLRNNDMCILSGQIHAPTRCGSNICCGQGLAIVWGDISVLRTSKPTI